MEQTHEQQMELLERKWNMTFAILIGGILKSHLLGGGFLQLSSL